MTSVLLYGPLSEVITEIEFIFLFFENAYKVEMYVEKH